MTAPSTIPEAVRAMTPDQTAFFVAGLCGAFAGALMRSGASPEQAELIVLQCLTSAHAEANEPGAVEAWLREEQDGPDPIFPSLGTETPQ